MGAGWQRGWMTRHIIQNAEQAADGRRTAPAALRNAEAIIQALRARLPARGRVLEVASGTGQHAAAFAAAFPDLDWVPSDVDAGQRDSIMAWRCSSGLQNLSDPLSLDIATAWPVRPGFAQAVLTINLFHLVPEALVARFFEQARAALTDGGRVIVYGPFLRGQDYASDGDRGFDASLRARDPAIGYKSVENVSDTAMATGFGLVSVDEMPANNLLLVFALPES